MRPMHEKLLADIFAERDRMTSRRALLAGGGKMALGGLMASAMVGAPVLRSSGVMAQDDAPAFADDIEVLNYALTLEHLEYAFYRDGIGQFTFGAGPFGEDVDTYLMGIRDHEGAHVAALTDTIASLGGTPVAEATYDFGYTDATSFLVTAAALENTGVSAYDGAGSSISDPGLLTVAGGIVAVEARHASYLSLLNGEEPAPSSFETPLSPDEVLAIAGPFIVS
jgi:Ferritin-like domain